MNAFGVDTRSDILRWASFCTVAHRDHAAGEGAVAASGTRRVGADDRRKRHAAEFEAQRLEQPARSRRRGPGPDRLSGIVRGELDWIAMKSPEKDRTRRYPRRQQVGRISRDTWPLSPVEAYPPTPGYRLTKIPLHYRVPLRVAGAFLMLLGRGCDRGRRCDHPRDRHPSGRLDSARGWLRTANAKPIRPGSTRKASRRAALNKKPAALSLRGGNESRRWRGMRIIWPSPTSCWKKSRPRAGRRTCP